MLNFPPAVRIWLGTAPVDLRRNQRGDRLKLLYWDEDGFVIVYKRLEEGTFRWPAVSVGQPSVAVRAAELAILLDGIDWTKAQRSRRYHRPATG
jgi:transposase